MSDIINKNISSKNRTTIMSTGNMMGSLFMSLIFFIFGFASDRFGVQGMFGLAAGSITVLLATIGLVFRRTIKSQ